MDRMFAVKRASCFFYLYEWRSLFTFLPFYLFTFTIAFLPFIPLRMA